MWTDEQIQVLLEMGDLTEQERQMLEQQQVSNQLRRMATGQGLRHRMDAGSQAARALSGVFSGMAYKKAGELGTGIGEGRRKVLRDMFPGRGNTPGIIPQTGGMAGNTPSQLGNYGAQNYGASQQTPQAQIQPTGPEINPVEEGFVYDPQADPLTMLLRKRNKGYS